MTHFRFCGGQKLAPELSRLANCRPIVVTLNRSWWRRPHEPACHTMAQIEILCQEGGLIDKEC
jgi:hypothetical protein